MQDILYLSLSLACSLLDVHLLSCTNVLISISFFIFSIPISHNSSGGFFFLLVLSFSLFLFASSLFWLMGNFFFFLGADLKEYGWLMFVLLDVDA